MSRVWNNHSPESSVKLYKVINCLAFFIRFSADRTLQDIVYKIVPNLKEVERKNRADFYRSIGRSPPPNEGSIFSNIFSYFC